MKAQMFNLFFMVNPHVTEEKMRTFSVKPCAGTPSPCVLPRRPWPIARPPPTLEKWWRNGGENMEKSLILLVSNGDI